MFRSITILFFLSISVWSVGLARSVDCHTGSYADKQQLKLPWETIDGKTTDSSGNVTLFKNVRYGQAPVGDLRFKASKFPEAKRSYAKVQDTAAGPICIQAGLPDSKTGQFPPKKDGETEDCLFLDIYVPTSAFKSEYPLPVVVYFYGGAFFYGYKDTTLELGSQKFNLYDGKGIMNASENEFIWVVGNYRVGAFGWLAGTTMEKDGTPNAGLHDQKLILEFVQEHIGKVNGDPRDVSVWGNSAGASSIMHHMTAGEDGQSGPVFDKAVLWSPAYQWAVDRRGTLEYTFTNFTKKAGCKQPTLECLRKVDAAVLRKANEEMVNESISTGSFPFGPALDGSYVRRIPIAGLEYYSYKRLRSVIVSHVIDEAGLFLPKLSWINSEDNFQKFLNITFPGDHLADVREAVTDVYPVLGDDDKKINQILRVKRIVRDSTFLCNAKRVIESQQNAWAMEFDFPPGLHGSDLLPTTWNSDVSTGKLIDELLGPYVNETTRRFIESKLAGFSSKYQRYFAGHAAFGSPNALLLDDDPIWELVESKFGLINKALHVGLDASLKPAFKSLPDVLLSSSQCVFWKNVASFIGDGLPEMMHSGPELKEQQYSLKVQSVQVSERDRSEVIPWELQFNDNHEFERLMNSCERELFHKVRGVLP